MGQNTAVFSAMTTVICRYHACPEKDHRGSLSQQSCLLGDQSLDGPKVKRAKKNFAMQHIGGEWVVSLQKRFFAEAFDNCT